MLQKDVKAHTLAWFTSLQEYMNERSFSQESFVLLRLISRPVPPRSPLNLG